MTLLCPCAERNWPAGRNDPLGRLPCKEFHLQAVARGGNCFSGFFSGPGAGRADFDVEVVPTEPARYLSAAWIPGGRTPLPGRTANASRFGLPAGAQRGLSSLPLVVSPCRRPGLLRVVPFSVSIPSLCPRPAQDFSFHVRSSEAVGSWMSGALRDTEQPVPPRGRDNQTGGSSPRRETPPSRQAQLVSLTCPLPSKACCLFLAEDDK